MNDAIQSYQNGIGFFDYPTETSYDWPSIVLKSPTEIREALESFHLIGRQIRHIRIMGLNYLHTRDRMEDFVYDQLDNLPEEERQRQSEYPNFAPHLQFYRQALIDEPLMIAFTDADVFEIDTPMTAQFLMSISHKTCHTQMRRYLY